MYKSAPAVSTFTTAPPRGSTSFPHHKPKPNMASGRSSPLRIFKQPASPKMEGTSAAAQQRLRPQNQRQTSNSGGSLRLPGLPRFHPANFPSTHSSVANTPTSGVNSPQPPMSPRSQQRQYSEAQRQLLSYQREMYAHKRTVSSATKPTSPRLMPLAGSPGPVTPLELEADSYLTARSGATTSAAQQEYVDKLIRQEAANRSETSPRRSAAVDTY